MPRTKRPAGLTLAALAVVGLAAAGALLVPTSRPALAAADRCVLTPDLVLAAVRPLPHVTARLERGGPLLIEALGSSSTYGTGASSKAKTYPARLGVLLARHYPGVKIRVVNRGVGGETATDMAKRIATQILPDRPDLVIWQIGTNGLLRHEDLRRMAKTVRAGIERMKRAESDVMLMNPQYAPAVLRQWHYRKVLRVIDAIAYAEDVPLVQRFGMMRHWAEDGRMPISMMLSRDRLHMTDASYDCLAQLVAATLDAATAPPAPGEAS